MKKHGQIQTWTDSGQVCTSKAKFVAAKGKQGNLTGKIQGMSQSVNLSHFSSVFSICLACSEFILLPTDMISS